MASLTGKTCLITGATSGIGNATAVGLASRGATLALVARGRERGESTRNALIDATGNENIDLMLADLSDQAEVRQLAVDVQARYPALHLLIHNAAVLPMEREATTDGIEMQLAVNHLASFLLTNLLLPQMIASAPARIVVVSSEAHRFSQLNLDDLNAEQAYDGMTVYGRTKLANLYFTFALARRLAGTGVTVNALHPGAVATRLGRSAPSWLVNAANQFMVAPEKGAETSIYLATARELENTSGLYYRDKKAIRAADIAYDESIGERLWHISAKLTGLAASAG